MIEVLSWDFNEDWECCEESNVSTASGTTLTSASCARAISLETELTEIYVQRVVLMVPPFPLIWLFLISSALRSPQLSDGPSPSVLRGLPPLIVAVL